MSDKEDFEKRDSDIRALLGDRTKRANTVRSKDREFHGLEREFFYSQAEMLGEWERSKDLKHARDLGDSREQILRNFLAKSGYLPHRYAVSDRSVRVVSPSGHISNEIDIALYDPIDSLTLMRRQDVYEAYPVESVYGVIQVKSVLSRKELRSGLRNIASFKKLDRGVEPSTGFHMGFGPPLAERGFGLLFAYAMDFPWVEIAKEIKAFADSQPPRLWPNAVFILNQGAFLFRNSDQVSYSNEAIEKIAKADMYGMPDRDGTGLFHFYSMLFNLLRGTAVHPAKLDRYFKLPLLAGDTPYAYTRGNFAEFHYCERHGDFARKITPKTLDGIIAWCQRAEPINWIRATDIAYGRPENQEAYNRQPLDVRIYNPEDLPLSEILLRDTLFAGKPAKGLAFDEIDTAGMIIWIPEYYAQKESIISSCPKCAKSRAKTKAKRPEG